MIRQLRAVWDAPPASPSPPRRVWRDLALVFALPIVIALETVLRGALPGMLLWAGALIAVVPLLLLRRTRPLLAFAIAFAVMTVVTLVVGEEAILYSTAFVILFPYAVFRWGSGRAVAVGLAVLLASYAVNNLVPPIALDDAIGGGVVLVIIVTVAMTFRFRASARSRDVERVRLLERERLARDLHDSVAHHVSAITVTAQAGIATAASNPAAALEALTVIEREASLTLADMRGMVHVLRADETPEPTPEPPVADLDALLRRDITGTPVTVEQRGDVDALPPDVAGTVYRIVQEAVTNARRHARNATQIAVLIESDAEGVRVEVSDDGDEQVAATPGFGLSGMRERAALLGGTVTAGRASGGGWTVTAQLPTAGWST